MGAVANVSDTVLAMRILSDELRIYVPEVMLGVPKDSNLGI